MPLFAVAALAGCSNAVPSENEFADLHTKQCGKYAKSATIRNVHCEAIAQNSSGFECSYEFYQGRDNSWQKSDAKVQKNLIGLEWIDGNARCNPAAITSLN